MFRPIRLVMILIALATASCATQPQVGLRDSHGNPVVARMTSEQWAAAAPEAAVRLSRTTIVELSRRGVPAAEIIDRYFQTGTRLAATASELEEMRRQGVDQQVLDYIASSDTDAQRIDSATTRAQRDARERESWLRWSAWSWYAPAGWTPRLQPFGGYAWSPWGSGWYGGMGLGF
jgi:hypothetical protein